VRFGNTRSWDCRLWRWSKCGSIDVHYRDPALITTGIGSPLSGSRVGLRRDAVWLSAAADNSVIAI
jgi:hypothetical protein